MLVKNYLNNIHKQSNLSGNLEPIHIPKTRDLLVESLKILSDLTREDADKLSNDKIKNFNYFAK